MNGKSGYHTKQQKALLDYIKETRGGHFTAADVYNHMKNEGFGVGQTTVYRQLEKFVDEGIVNKYILENNSSACFEYVGEDSHSDCDICFHCKCEKCGKLIHMHCDELEGIKDHLEAEHDFLLTPHRTVFYGICKECAKAAEK